MYQTYKTTATNQHEWSQFEKKNKEKKKRKKNTPYDEREQYHLALFLFDIYDFDKISKKW